jgi:hypothetical protein
VDHGTGSCRVVKLAIGKVGRPKLHTSESELGTGYFFDHPSWGQALLELRKAVSPLQKQSPKKLPVPISRAMEVVHRVPRVALRNF